MLGLAIKNSILLVDFIIRYRKAGHNRTDAILEAGPVRLRPILMTSLAIILGMLPTAVGWGSSGTFRAPMAITVIGGVFTATLLSLLVVPVIYTIFDDIKNAISKLFLHNSPALLPANGENQLLNNESKATAEGGNPNGQNTAAASDKQEKRRWFRKKE
jgi:predicted RND superfamily exporter protein